jgi:hypothetical protein
MTEDARFTAYNALLDEPQFSRTDVLDITGLSDGQLKGILDRQQVVLRAEHNPGTGRRRMFTGSDIIKIAVANGMSGIGFPMRWAYLVADDVARRASFRMEGVDFTPGLSIATYPNATGDDWVRVPIYTNMPEQPKLPAFVQLLKVDQLIDEIVAKLKAVVEEKPLPSFDIPEPEPPDPDFARRRAKDEQGRDVLVGLTHEETTLYQEYSAKDWKLRTDEKAFPWPSVQAMNEERARWLELHDKHEEARLKRINEEAQKRNEENVANLKKSESPANQALGKILERAMKGTRKKPRKKK